MTVRELAIRDRSWLRGVLRRHWGSTALVSRGRLHRGERLPGLVAIYERRRAGLLLYEEREGALEVVLLHALVERRGVGSALLAAARERGGARGCARLWLVTTNDNLPAMGFYSRRGLAQVAVHAGAVDEARRLKPEIPLLGLGGVPIRDEIEFELRFPAAAAAPA